MQLFDVNVLIYAHRVDLPEHAAYAGWMREVLQGPESFGLVDMVLSGFVRIVTHAKVFAKPTPVEQALEFVDALRSADNCVMVEPGARHWSIFADLCRSTKARGNRVPDAYLAALAIESGNEWITADRGFSRYPGLRWRHPLES